MAPNGLMMSYKPGDYDLAVGSGILPNIGRVAVGLGFDILCFCPVGVWPVEFWLV